MGVMVRSLKALLMGQSIVSDNIIFRLHYKVTVTILVICGIIVLCWQYLGDPLNCISKDDIPSRLLDSYCWMDSTFSIEEALSKKVGHEVPYPGIDYYRPGERRIFHLFYQWVGFVLLVQSIFFYLPHFICKRLESRQVNRMILNLSSTTCGDKNDGANKDILVHYFVSRFNRHICYCVSYFICEILNVINVIAQICFIDSHLGDAFSAYGFTIFKSVQQNSSSDYNPMVRVFPRMAKCAFYRYGSSGDVQRHDAVCVLTMNGLNEKIYFFLLFWFIILAILSCITVVYRIILCLSSKIRARILLIRARQPQEQHINAILNNCNVGDWFLLDLMCTNLDPVNFRDIIRDISLRVGEKELHEI